MTRRFNTRAVQAGEYKDSRVGNVITPIFENATFYSPNESSDPERDHTRDKSYMYTRWGNPTLQALERKYASLDLVDEGLSFSSGMAAITTTILALLKKGDRLLSLNELYGETFLFFTKTLPSLGIEVDLVPIDRINSNELDLSGYAAVFTESIVNPTLGVSDLSLLGNRAKEMNVPVIVDATFASPYNQNPSTFDTAVTIHSGTKYLNGHSDLILGMAGFSKEYMQKLWMMRKSLGGVPDPLQAYLALRGLKTLGLRMKAHNDNAMKFSTFLSQHSKVKQVNYPGLEDFKFHDIAKRNLTGFGGMVSFELKDGLPGARNLMKRLKIGASAPSLGGVETLITLPIDTSHGSLTPEQRAEAGISEGLIRLSIGIEDSEDLIEDFQEALS